MFITLCHGFFRLCSVVHTVYEALASSETLVCFVPGAQETID